MLRPFTRFAFAPRTRTNPLTSGTVGKGDERDVLQGHSYSTAISENAAEAAPTRTAPFPIRPPPGLQLEEGATSESESNAVGAGRWASLDTDAGVPRKPRHPKYAFGQSISMAPPSPPAASPSTSPPGSSQSLFSHTVYPPARPSASAKSFARRYIPPQQCGSPPRYTECLSSSALWDNWAVLTHEPATKERVEQVQVSPDVNEIALIPLHATQDGGHSAGEYEHAHVPWGYAGGRIQEYNSSPYATHAVPVSTALGTQPRIVPFPSVSRPNPTAPAYVPRNGVQAKSRVHVEAMNSRAAASSSLVPTVREQHGAGRMARTSLEDDGMDSKVAHQDFASARDSLLAHLAMMRRHPQHPAPRPNRTTCMISKVNSPEEWEAMLDVLQRLIVEIDQEPDSQTIGRMIGAAIRAGREEELTDILCHQSRKYQHLKLQPSTRLLNRLAVHLFKVRRPEEALRVYALFNEKGLERNRMTYEAFMRGFVKTRKLEMGLAVAREAVARGLILDPATWQRVLLCTIAAQDPALGEAWFKNVIPAVCADSSLVSTAHVGCKLSLNEVDEAMRLFSRCAEAHGKETCAALLIGVVELVVPQLEGFVEGGVNVPVAPVQVPMHRALVCNAIELLAKEFGGQHMIGWHQHESDVDVLSRISYWKQAMQV